MVRWGGFCGGGELGRVLRRWCVEVGRVLWRRCAEVGRVLWR